MDAGRAASCRTTLDPTPDKQGKKGSGCGDSGGAVLSALMFRSSNDVAALPVSLVILVVRIEVVVILVFFVLIIIVVPVVVVR